MAKHSSRAIVIGAGIVGLTTACRLAEHGFEVTVIERNAGPGDGTSKANAGQLLFDRISAMGSPGFLRAVPGVLRNPTNGIRARALLHPSQWPWGLRFVRECSQQAWERNTAALLRLAHRSREAMAAFQIRHPLSFDARRPGKLVIHATPAALDAARKVAAFQAQFGGRHEILTAEQSLMREPALTGGNRPFAGAVWMPDAEVGDCLRCCHELARVLETRLGGTIRYKINVNSLSQIGNRITGVVCDQGHIAGDVFVVTTGGQALELLPRRFANRKPITPVLGVSLTYPLGPRPPDLSVTDAAGRFVLMRLGDRLRVTGHAVFSSERQVPQADIAALKSKAEALMPGAADWSAAPSPWVGARPQTPDDLPMIGEAGAENLYVNAGHGSLGWTLAFGSADLLAQKILDAQPASGSPEHYRQ